MQENQPWRNVVLLKKELFVKGKWFHRNKIDVDLSEGE